MPTYGRAVGAAFQVADDLLDAEGDAAALGKRAGKDAARNKATLVAALGLEGARRELARLVDEANAAIDAAGLGAAGDRLRAAAAFRRGAKELKASGSRTYRPAGVSSSDAPQRSRGRVRS